MNDMNDTWTDEAIDGWLAGNFGIGSICDAGHSLFVSNCVECVVLQMHLSGEVRS